MLFAALVVAMTQSISLRYYNCGRCDTIFGEAMIMCDAERTRHATPGGTSATLLQRLRTNEAEALREMGYLYTPLVYRWCAGLGVRGADADDVSQEVFQARRPGWPGSAANRRRHLPRMAARHHPQHGVASLPPTRP